MDELLKELQTLIDKYKDGTPEGTSEEEAEKDEARMAELTEQVARMTAEKAKKGERRAAAVEAVRAAIESGSATAVSDVPLARSASASGGVVRDVTDYDGAEKRAWLKDIATRSGVMLAGGNELTVVERAAFTTLTSNTEAVVPKEIQGKIISLIDNSAVLFGDVSRDNFRHQFELPRHVGITQGDAAKTEEGKAPTDEKNEFDNIALVGEEIKKTARISRKMAVQSVDGFESWLIKEVAARLAVAANALVHARLDDAKLGMAAANKITCAKAGTLAKADLARLLGQLYTFGNPVPKGCIIYANNNTIWNEIAMMEDKSGRSYFVDEKTEDPAIQGRIFGKWVKQDDACANGVIKAGYPDLVKGNVFDGVDVTGYVATDGTQNHCFDGYLLYDCGLAVPQGFGQLDIGTASA